MWWKCEKGHEWQATITSRNKGIGCPICSNKQVLIGYNDLVTINPKLVEEWNYEKNDKEPQEYLPNSNKKVWWKCKQGHEWRAIIASRNRGIGCPICANQQVLSGYNDLATTNPELLEDWDYNKNKITPQKVTGGSDKKVWWCCKQGHEWKASINYRTNGRGCPYCSGSKTERLTYRLLNEQEIPFIAEKKFNYAIKVKFYPYDVWILNKRLIVELDGIQHFSDKYVYFTQEIPFKVRVRRDNIKNEFCVESKIPILRIPYTYNPEKDKKKIRDLLNYFIETRKIPQEIIDFYEQYDFSNYSEIAKEMNTW